MKAKTLGSAVLFVLTLLLMLTVLELNKNTLPGWALTLAASAGSAVLIRRSRSAGIRGLIWLGWLLLFAAVLVLTWPPVKAVPAAEGKNGGKTGVISLADGDVRGVLTADGKVEIYAGIPYAKPPVGDLRWRAPEDPLPWDGILDADHFAPMSMQPVHLPIYDSLAQIIGFHDYRISLTDNYRPPVSEDSLYVNVWKPAGEHDALPVLVYVHGGSLQTGQPWYADYSGESLAREGIVVVNMGYRLGVFGFLAEEELLRESGTAGNYGLLDQIKALEWVRDNIAAFGGDPSNVTLAGESAGAASVSALSVSPLAAGLFRRVVLESSTLASVQPPHSYRAFGEALESGRELMDRYGVSSVEELRALPADKLVGEADTQHHITPDGYVLTESPYESLRRGIHNGEAIFHGFNLHESGAFLLFGKTSREEFSGNVRGYFGDYADEVFVLYPVRSDEEADTAWREIWGAVFFDYPHYCLNRLAVQNGIPVWEYRFSKENGRLGSWHSGEEVYLYGNIPEGSKLYDARDRELSREMFTAFKNFVVSGDPNGGAGIPWEQNLSSADLMEFGDRTGMIKESERKLGLYGILDKMQGETEPEE